MARPFRPIGPLVTVPINGDGWSLVRGQMTLSPEGQPMEAGLLVSSLYEYLIRWNGSRWVLLYRSAAGVRQGKGLQDEGTATRSRPGVEDGPLPEDFPFRGTS